MKTGSIFHKFLTVCTALFSGISFFGCVFNFFFSPYPNFSVALDCVDAFYKCSILWFCLCCLILIADAIIAKYRTTHIAFSYRLKVWALSASLLAMFGWRIIYTIMIF